MRDLDLAYVAGFLDGDGAIMAEVEKRADLRAGVRVRIVVQFAQKATHEHVLEHIRSVLGFGGAINRDNRSGSSYRLKDQASVRSLLEALQPFVVAKREQLLLALQVLAATDMSVRSALARQIAALNVRSRQGSSEPAIPPVTTSGFTPGMAFIAPSGAKSTDAITRWQPGDRLKA